MEAMGDSVGKHRLFHADRTESVMTQKYWDEIYKDAGATDFSWYQPEPTVSLDFIDTLGVERDARIIDIGGGDSSLVDSLIKRGFRDLTVLDISAEALDRTRNRLGKDVASRVKLVKSDVLGFQPPEFFDLWHDRATFHFLTSPEAVRGYLKVAAAAVKSGGALIVSTFNHEGPTSCSGLPIRQYDEGELSDAFRFSFGKIKCFNSDHETPWGKVQHFIYCGFRRI